MSITTPSSEISSSTTSPPRDSATPSAAPSESSPSGDETTKNDNISSTVSALEVTSSPSDAEGSSKPGTEVGSKKEDNSTDFQKLGLDLHNKIRANHASQKLTLNKTMNEMAQTWAEKVLKSGKLLASPGKREFSENVFRISGGTPENPITNKEAVESALQSWYESQRWFNHDKPKPTGFSQIVWNDTTQLGIGLASSADTSIVVATYFPRGNLVVIGSEGDTLAKFKKNVFPMINNPSKVFP